GTTGRDAGGTKTTSILLIDGSPNANNAGNPTDYYMGLRNIDMFLKGNGTIGLENGSLNIGLKDMLLALSTEIAAGYLPGAKYKTCPTAGSCTSPIDNFAKNNDVLFGLKLRLGGDLNLSIVPNSSIADGSALTVL
ncbi:heme utilization protein, partial [Acinetobacter baumannii]